MSTMYPERNGGFTEDRACAVVRKMTHSSMLSFVINAAAATGEVLTFVTVRDGDEATLPCNSLMYGSKNCNSTEWLFGDSSRQAVGLVTDGQIVEAAKDKSDRLSVSEKCSLVIENVTDEDVARYDCRQFRSGQHGPNAVVFLSVVNMTEHEGDDEVTLRCSVSTFLSCDHTVKWLLQGQDVEEDNKDFRTSQSKCSASLTFLTSHFIYTSRFNSFQCKVTRGDKVQQFTFRNSPSGEKTGDDTTTPPAISSIWWYVTVAVALVALLIITVALIKWKRTKVNTRRTDGNVGMTSHPAPETSQDTADPEEGVSYASVSYTKTNSKAQADPEEGVSYASVSYKQKTNSKAQADPEEGVSYASVSYTKKTNSKAQGRSKHDDDDDDAVTYATVKASSADPSILYAAIT